MNAQLGPLLRMAPVVPVLVINNLDNALPLARALVKGGLPLLEITLRTEAALEAIELIAAEVEGAVVGAGTVLDNDQLEAVARRGAKFAVSPGVTDSLLAAAKDIPTVPLLPGTATASEVMRLLDHGFEFMKFFPAEQAGGASYLNSLASPLPKASFCPTGGVTLEKAAGYLKLDNVVCVGGSWVAPKEAVEKGDWSVIEKLASEAARL